MLAPMQTLVAPARRGGRVSLPLDASRAIDRLLEVAPLDLVHVHEPFAPSAAAAALRHSRALNVGSFHSPTERVLSTQVARRFIELFFGRLDARMATYDVTRGLISSFFPGDYTVVRPGVDLERFAPGRPAGRPARDRLRARRGAGVPAAVPARAAPPSAGPRVDRDDLVARRRRTSPRGSRARCGSACGCPGRAASRSRRCSHGRTRCAPRPPVSRPRTTTVMKAIATGAVPVASRIPVYEEVLRDGADGLLFEPGDAEVLGAQLARLVTDRELLLDLRRRCLARRPEIGWDRVVDEIERTYRRVIDRRHRPPPDRPAIARRLSTREFIHCDLHMHTDHSPDCATPVDVLLETAKQRGLGAIAITDHNEISGALEARERAKGIKVIVSEEVKTAHEGEVIGLFIEEKIPRGMTLKETIDAIHAQGGLAYVPHPFDRLHAIPDYEHLLKVVGDIDVLEVFNARVAVRGFNEEAQRFADKYRLVAGAGSDSHVAQGLGTVKIRMRAFDGAQEFLESLRDADILHKRKSLIYLQSLKFLQTAGGRAGGGMATGQDGRAARRPASRR